MERVGYPDLERHRALHEAIVARMTRTMTAASNLETMMAELRHLILDWVVVHIQREDRKLVPYLAAVNA